MKKVIYALIAIPLFIIGPLGLLTCTECGYPNYIPSYVAFVIASLIYYIVVIIPLNFFYKQEKII
ncbi:MAG: hypothetical protein PHN31_04775 [Candidatus Gracilibacteria bacterium]|nr:hypothetical protein [Candidatus Gracilibacteria bacterium]